MKKYNLSKIMKRAWELVKNFGATISEGLKEAWKEAKNMAEKIKFNGTAIVGKVRKGENRPEEVEVSGSNFYKFSLWEKGSKRRIYISDYQRRSMGYIDLNNNNEIEVNYSQDSDQYRTAKWFVENYEF